MEPTLKQALTLMEQGKTAKAGEVFSALLRKTPNNARLLLAATQFFFRNLRDLNKAQGSVDRLVKLHPESADAQCLAAEVFLQAQNRKRARHHAQKAFELAPDAGKVLTVMAAVHIAEAEFDDALPYAEKALAQAPNDLGAKYQLARILITQGRFDETLALINDVLDEMPDAMPAIGTYLQAQKITSDDPVFVRMRDEMLPRFRKQKHPSLANLLKHLGTAYNQIGDYDAAIRSFTKAKALEPQRYETKAYAGFVDALCDGISADSDFGRGDDSETPVLIVGMPRSGSTLLEQILAGHPEIGSVGESPVLRRIVRETGVPTQNGQKMVRAVDEMPDAAAKRLAARYLAETERPGAARVVDKSLHNFELLGFFAAMLPKARIIHIRRDPLDTCTSCFMQFLPDSHTYTRSLDLLGHKYLQYIRLMAHWREVLPNPMLSVHYEDVVADLEGQARRVIDFLGLGWDPACLNFQEADNQVQTISVHQVRQPVYTASLQRWRRYDRHLKPLKTRLAPLYPDGFEAPAARD